MDWSASNIFFSMTAIILSAMISLYLYITRKYDYWKKKNIPFIKPKFPFGNVDELFRLKVHQTQFFERIYHQFPEERFVGMFELSEPVLVVRDLDLIQKILVQDFCHFSDRTTTPNLAHNWIHLILANKQGEEWKMVRGKCFSPNFSTSKLKSMFEQMERFCLCGKLKTCMERRIAEDQAIDVYDLLYRFSTDISAACSAGLHINTMENEHFEFFKYVNMFFLTHPGNIVKRFLVETWPKLLSVFKIYKTDPIVQEFFLGVVTSVVDERNRNQSKNKDFIDLLLAFKRNGSENNNDPIAQHGEDKLNQADTNASDLSIQEMTSLFVNWFAAGAEISGGVTAMALFSLCQHPQIQERARKEVDQVLERHNGNVTFEALNEVKYVDMVIYETIRLHRAIFPVKRICTKPYRLPGTDAVLDKGVKIIIPHYAIHHDPLLFPKPYEFIPERFSKEHTRHRFAFLPFGEGPRGCVGLRFGMMQTRAALVTLLKDFQFSTCSETPSHLEQDPSMVFYKPQKQIKLRARRR